MQPPVMTRRSSRKQSGFTLVEMAIVVMIVGLIVGAYFSWQKPHDAQQRETVTRARMQTIARALGDFAQRNNRIPCPADPANLDAPSVFGEERADCVADPNDHEGIVPFRDLGLTQLDATDAYGNIFTYHVQPNAAAAPPVNENVHLRCRVQTIWVRSDPVTGANTNINPEKARFCCRRVVPPTDQLVVSNNPNGVVAQATGQQNDVVTPIGNFDDVDTLLVPAANGDQLNYIAYVLVSHGANGEGAYTVFPNPGAGGRRPINAVAVDEIENTDVDEDFNDFQRNSSAGANHFDDIVLWRTQFGVISELGNDSCARP